MVVQGELEFLDQVYVDFPLKNEVLEGPNNIPNGCDHILVWMRVDL
jgi:hypothetical protein